MKVNGMIISKVEQARKIRDKFEKEFKINKIAAAEAAAVYSTADRSQKVEAAKASAESKLNANFSHAELRKAEKTLAKFIQDEIKESETLTQSEKRINQRALEEKKRKDAAGDPFLASDVDWTALGIWFANSARNVACYVDGAGWGDWTGANWRFTRKPDARLLDKVRNLYKDKSGTVATKILSNPKSALYILEHSQGALTRSREIFNASSVAHLVAFKNITVNLKTGEEIPNNPEHYMTGCMQCLYDKNCSMARVKSAFQRFWPNDLETAEMFQTAIGYSATGEISAKRTFFMVGNQDESMSNGDNGKSLVQNALTRLFGLGIGGWATAVKPGIIIDTGDRDANSHDGAKTSMIWRRFAMASEPRKGSTIDSGEFNRLSGGDIQTARPPHAEHSIEFVNTATLWISMNSVIRFKTWDRATKVRFTPFPFQETFYNAGDEPVGGQIKELGLKEWLESDQGQKALAGYIVEGAIRFYALNGGSAGNFPDSAAVIRARDNLLNAANPFSEMFESCFIQNEGCDLKKTAVSAIFKSYNGCRPKPFEMDIIKEFFGGWGVVEKKIRGERFWRGLSLTDEGRKHASLNGIVCAEYKNIVKVEDE